MILSILFLRINLANRNKDLCFRVYLTITLSATGVNFFQQNYIMKHTVFLSFLLLSFCFSFSQTKLQKAPPNPDYIKFIENYRNGEDDLFAAPAPALLNFKKYFEIKKGSSPKDFPVVYDMRTAGPGGTSLLTSVKNQSGCGACWAFATYGSMESVWKIMELGDNDLSENNLKNCSGYELDPCQWGHHFMSTAYLVRGSGPVTEADDPWVPSNQSCTGSFTPAAYIPVSRYLPEDHDAFKETIMTKGAVYNTYRSVSSGYQWINGHLTYCYQGAGTTTHAIAIVGWNDTITTACGNGAWICKNQYGTGFGEDGYFYISYQDTLVLKYNAIWPEREEWDTEMHIYQIDEIGGWPFIDQIITRIGTYTVSFGTTLTVEVYDDFDGTNLTGLLKSIPAKYCNYPGFRQIDFPEPLRVNEGDDFYVKVKYNSPDCDFPIASEGYDEGYSDPVIESGMCWTKEENGPWEAIGMGTDFEADLCIKAYAYDIVETEVKAFLEGPFNILEMNTCLSDSALLPFTQPFNTEPWNYSGSESVTSIPSDAVDWILVELRDAPGATEAGETTIIDRKAGFILKNGLIKGIDGISNLTFDVRVIDSLFVVISHRNHCAVMSATGLIKTNGVYQYDFTTAAEKAFGGLSVQKEITPGVYGMKAGDGNADGVISIDDIIDVWKPQAGKSGYLKSDFNLDGQSSNVDKNDIQEF